MKKIFYTFLVTLCLSANLYGQITIDSIFVYQTPATDSTSCFVDSISINGTHTGQVLKKILVRSPLLNALATTIVVLTFEGCDSMSTTIYDTTVTVNAFTGNFVIFSIWDTTTNCSYPTEPIFTDTLVSYSCLPSNTNKRINEKQVKVYPNPARDILTIEYSEAIRPRKIQLMNINGTVVKSFEPNERLLDIQTVSSGLFFLIIETQDGYYLRKKVIVQ
jgi:hypothetical protein